MREKRGEDAVPESREVQLKNKLLKARKCAAGQKKMGDTGEI